MARRPLDAVYPIVDFDALKDEGGEDRSVRNLVCYLALRVTCEGEREVPGCRVARLERALGRTTTEVEMAGERLQGGREDARRPVPRAGRAGSPRRSPGRGRGARARDGSFRSSV